MMAARVIEIARRLYEGERVKYRDGARVLNELGILSIY